MGRTFYSVSALLFFCLLGHAQPSVPVNGIRYEPHTTWAFVGATLFTDYKTEIANATLLVKDGVVVAAGAGVEVPEGAAVVPCSGLFIYPSFIDLYSGLGHTKQQQKPARTNTSHWNDAVHADYLHYQLTTPEQQRDWLSTGFGTVNLHRRDGVFRGQSSVLQLGVPETNLSTLPLRLHHLSFKKGTAANAYPSSFVGAVALVRQVFYDAQAYGKNPGNEVNSALEAIQINNPVVFELPTAKALRTAGYIASEFQLNALVKLAGDEYPHLRQWPKALTAVYSPNFPKAMQVSDPYEAASASTSELQLWEAAPHTAAEMQGLNIPFCLSRDTLSQVVFLKNLQKAMDCGLSHEQAMKALTITPAQFISGDGKHGQLKPGSVANFFFTPQRLGQANFKVIEHWTQGRQAYVAPNAQTYALMGVYSLVIDSVDFELTVSADGKAEVKKKGETEAWKTEMVVERTLITLVLSRGGDEFRLSGKASLGGTLLDGSGVSATGQWIQWAAIRSPEPPTAAATAQKAAPESPRWSLPFVLPDSLALPKAYVLTGATVWTAAAAGTVEQCDVWVENGRIKAVGTNSLFPTELRRISASGKHITPGIIDEHSHIALWGGVNEGGQSVSAEVRMADAVDASNINIYRQLAGGVTTAQLLHGSANPIGGQSALIKMKWGKPADSLLVKDAPAFIKFALGENVKRSTSQNNQRYPNTRMGVEQVMAEAFVRARDYDEKLIVKKTEVPAARHDLELEAIAEILRGERHITCHSYVQSEVLMLLALADSLGFDVRTFTHILEGYKVADSLAADSAFASTFSDWWAYKFEVNDAIPHNAALLTRAGVVTCINSDDAEMGRRLNHEAAKTMKYGGLSADEAIKLITINPAKALAIDKQTGSVEVGKQADLVVWSGHPLSVYSHVEKTIVEGHLYFDKAHEKNQLNALLKERQRLVAAMQGSGDKKPVKPEQTPEYHCDSETDYGTE